MDADEFIKQLNDIYKGSMTELCITPLGVENWINDVSIYNTNYLIYPPTAEHEEKLNEELNTLHKKNDLDSVIKELTVICSYYEAHQMNRLQTECFRKALAFLILLKNGGMEND